KPIRRSRVATTRATRSERNQPMISRMMAPARAGKKERMATRAAVTETSSASPKLVICGMAIRSLLWSRPQPEPSRNGCSLDYITLELDYQFCPTPAGGKALDLLEPGEEASVDRQLFPFVDPVPGHAQGQPVSLGRPA